MIMGHVPPGMDENYVELFDTGRLQAVADAVHDWLFTELDSWPVETEVLPFQAYSG